VFVEEGSVAFPKNVLVAISKSSRYLGLEALHMGIAKRETTTWMLAIHMNVGKTPPFMIQS
jgi:hypothetical protein